MDDFLKTLKDKEKELQAKLAADPTFQQLESIRQTITTFQGTPKIAEIQSIRIPTGKVKIPKLYDSEELTWKEKILFVINKLGQALTSEIVSELGELGEADGKETGFLNKRVSVMLSAMKNQDGIIDSRSEGKKSVYFIK